MLQIDIAPQWELYYVHGSIGIIPWCLNCSGGLEANQSNIYMCIRYTTIVIEVIACWLVRAPL